MSNSNPQIGGCWQQAAGIDKTLRTTSQLARSLARLELPPRSYSRRRLFSAMVAQQPIIFFNHPLRYTLNPFFNGGDQATVLRKLFRSSVKTLARLGPAKRARLVKVHDVIDKWERNRAVISANDIHYRIERLDRTFDCDAIAEFNILPTAPPRLNHLEVATLLMGTKGCMTDSHSDDPDGCNHCIAGKKLWLVWDREEGRRRGLQDCEYDYVNSQARFSLNAFLGVSSARWFLMTEGRTLFLPGNFTHKVITLEKYLGISSFYLGLPNALSSVSRWKTGGTIMVNEPYRNELINLLVAHARRIAVGDRRVKEIWGFYHLRQAIRSWRSAYSQRQRDQLLSDRHFMKLFETLFSYAHEP